MVVITSLLESASASQLVTVTHTARDNGNSTSSSTDIFFVPDARAAQNMRTAWIALQLAGQITLPILIATLLFHKRIARRNPTIVNLCIVWTLATIPPELLFYTGEYKGPLPSTMLCLFQAATISAVPPMAGMAYLAVVIHACTVINDLIKYNTPRPFALDLRMVFLLSSPYICFFGFSLMIAIIGSQHPNDVKRSLFFCEIIHHRASIPVFSFAVIVVLLTLFAQAWIAVMFYRNYNTRRRRWAPHTLTNSRPSFNISAMDIQLFIRMVAFTVFEVVIVFSSISALLMPNMFAAQLLFATPPFAVFVIFSSSRDIYEAWFPCIFRRKAKSSQPSSSDPKPEKTPPQLTVRTLSPPPVSSPNSPSTISRYSQASLGVPAPAAVLVKGKRSSSSWGYRDLERDGGLGLAKGGGSVPLGRKVHVERVEQDVRVDFAERGGEGRLVLYQEQEHSTVIVVDGSNLPSQDTPLHAIRALRMSTGTRKSRMSNV